MPTTTIQIGVEVREQLRSRGRMGESYNDVILRLLAATRSMELNQLEGRDRLPAAGRKAWVPQQDRG